jgi:hypothetical protein
MLEIDKENHKIIISRPDKHSLNIKNFFEKYYLGEILYEIKYEKIIYSEDNLKDYTKLDGKMGEGSLLLSECIIKTKNKYLWIKDDIYERDI